MERKYDAGFRQRASRDGKQVDAQRQEMMEVHDVRPHQLQEFDVRLDQQAIGDLVPLVVIVAAEKQELVRTTVEPGDARAALVKRRHAGIGRGQQCHFHVRPFTQRAEQLIADLLRAAAHKLGMKKAYQKDFHRRAHRRFSA